MVDTSSMTTEELIRREADAILNGTAGTAPTSSAQLPATLGAKAGSASVSVVPASDASFALASVGYDVQTTITRPANQTAYTAGDVVGGAIDLGVLGPSAKPVLITGTQLELDITAIPSGMTSFRLHLYSVTPPSALADNAAWDLPSGDRASYLGYVDMGSPADLGSTCYVEANGINKQTLLAGAHLFGYLVTTGGFTPAANSEVYKITLHTLAV